VSGNKCIQVCNKTQVTATFSVDIDVPEGSGGTLVTDVSNAGTGSVAPKIEGVTPHGTVFPLLTGVAIVANGQQVLKIGRGLTAAANAVANDQLPAKVRITFTHANANPMDYKASLCLTP
jgi:hypothetical protein